MNYVESGILGFTFIICLANAVHLISKARVAVIEKEILAAKAKLVADGANLTQSLRDRITSLEDSVFKPKSSVVSQASSVTSLPAPPVAPASSQPVA